MKKYLLILTIFLLLLETAAFAEAGQDNSGDVLEHRSWQFQSGRWSDLRSQIPKAKKMGMNRIQLSHRIIMDVHEMWDGPSHFIQSRMVSDCLKQAKKNGLKVDVWVHEFSNVPDKFVSGGKLQISDELWDWLRGKYVRFFDMFPEVDGLVLTFAETQYKLYLPEEVDAGEDVLAHFVKMIDVIAEECEKRGKLLIVRTFIHRPEELDVVVRGIKRASEEIKRDNIIVMSKCAPHDWHPYYPYSPVFDQDMGFPMIVEVDSGQEYTGKSWIPHAEVDYTRHVMRIARNKGVIGAVTRVDRYEYPAIGTLNEVNVYAFSRLLHDPGLSSDDIWFEWAGGKFGKDAAPLVASALDRTFDITNLILFPMQEWFYDHSRIPSYDYVRQNFSDYGCTSVARWLPNPQYESNWEAMTFPDGDTFIKVAHEKELAGKLLTASMSDLEAAKPFLQENDYAELKNAFEKTGAILEISGHHALAVLKTRRYETLLEKPGGSRETQQLKKEISAHLDALAVLGPAYHDRFGNKDSSFGGVKSKLEKFVKEIRGIIDA
ncbi:MAG TPA: hypothetical protein PLN69_08865 [bacterium]|nr:hypothetical protein [bacterium]